MVYVPRTLMLGRCWRCGKRVFRYDDYFTCPKCNSMYCSTCARKTFGKCPADNTELEAR